MNRFYRSSTAKSGLYKLTEKNLLRLHTTANNGHNELTFWTFRKIESQELHHPQKAFSTKPFGYFWCRNFECGRCL